ncbi:MAG TPA: sterol desaturase family protein [Jatrophihabitantaceae bacterium]|jgi:sterol desaturase/sphingolipid hydroxylase (fatty acid hydroxylase superfamily)|nr:sterol desaturase family protein [Jatrophihabitantaceae bacterium]
MSLPAQLQDPIVYALPAFVAFILIEIVSMRFLADHDSVAGFDRRDSRTSILMGLGSLVISGTSRAAALLLYVALYAVTPLRLDAHRWWTWVITLLLVDVIWYSYHRMSHRVRLMWAGHQAHHNSQHFNLTTAVRQKWNPWFELLFWVPLPLLGVPPWMIFTSFSVNLIFQFFVHTERVGTLWGWFEFVFNTPSHHRVHHASDPDYLDRNYAGILIIWDRLLGTYAAETHRPTYGLTTNIDSYNPFVLQYYEYGAIIRDVRAAAGWRERVGYLLAPPGWKPEEPAILMAEAGHGRP